MKPRNFLFDYLKPLTMKKKLFQFAVLYHEVVSEENKKDKVTTSIVIQPETILAMDDKTALLQIAKRIPDALQDHLQDVEILLRPF